jgi:hypothetical protein
MTTDDEAGRYEVRVKGHLAPRWAAWFDGMTLTNETDGTTSIRGPVTDQAALHGLLQRLRDTGLTLISVTQLERSISTSTPTPRRNAT